MTLSQRTTKTINRGWVFTYDPSTELNLERMEPANDTSSWQAIALPHTWNTYETTRQVHPFIHDASERDHTFWWYGWGWYRKTIHIEDVYHNKKIFLEFDGVQKYSKVWLNGHFVGEHKGGFTSFSLDVTEHVHFNGPNVIAVAVSNRRNDRFGGIPPMTAGNWNVYGGIYRDVRIVITDEVHVPFQGSAEHEGGTFITTPEVSKESGTVRVRTYVKNDAHAPRLCLVRTIIKNGENTVVTSMQSEQTLEAGTIQEIDQTSSPIAQPKLWSPEQPYVYRVETEIWHEDRLLDHVESTFGFRWFHWDYEQKCLFLNGEKVHIHGTNRHQEYPWLGDAIPKWMHSSDLHDIKYNLGHNFIRTCHYTQDPFVYDWADQHGLIVCEEVPNIKNISFGDDIQEQHVREMIRRDRNHPSILIWSMGNETDHAADGAWAREEDDTRIIHFRHVHGRGEDEAHTHEQLEMENLLRCTIRGWYNADVKHLEPEIGQHTGHEKWQHDMALIQDASQRGRIDMNGVMWIYADHGADREYVNSPLKHVNPKGWVDAYRVPKLMYYLWQAHYLERPMVFIHPYDWTLRYVNRHRDITVNSNCEEVSLFVNGTKAGTLFPTKENDFTVVFENILVEKGNIVAKGYIAGRETVVDEVVMAGKPARIMLHTESKHVSADRAGIALVKVDIVDEEGHHVYGATNDLHFSLAGPGQLVCPEQYVSDIDRHESMAGTMYITSPVYVPIRSTNEAGTITLTVSSPGLERASIELLAVDPIDQPVHGLHEPPVEVDASLSMQRHADLLAQYAEQKNEAEGMTVPLIQIEIDWSEKQASTFEMEMERFLSDYLNHLTVQDDPAFDMLRDVFVQQLIKDNGMMVADDFNYLIEQFNTYLQLTHLIERDIQASPEEKRKLKETYAERLIIEGAQMDPYEELDSIRI